MTTALLILMQAEFLWSILVTVVLTEGYSEHEQCCTDTTTDIGCERKEPQDKTDFTQNLIKVVESDDVSPHGGAEQPPGAGESV